jgi:Uma2 family endonuclease
LDADPALVPSVEFSQEEEMAVALTKRRFTVDEYHRMAEVGILTEKDRVELIDGEIVEMAPIGAQHASVVKRLNALLTGRLGTRAIVGVQDPVELSRESEPQPDVVLLRPTPDFYAAGHPEPVDTLLLIEVADTSLTYDRGVKLPRYAAAGIPEVWIVDLGAEAVETCRTPSPDGYRDLVRVPRGGSLSPIAFPDLMLGVDEILGPRQA